MKLNVEYFENEIQLNDESVQTFEIENKRYFYRFVKDLYNISNEIEIEEIKFFDSNFKEINMLGKIQIFTNFFDFNFESKKYSNNIIKYLNENIKDNEITDLSSKYKKLTQSYKKILSNIDLPLMITEQFDISIITKMLKVKVNEKEDIMDNLLLLIDIEKELKLNKLLIFINLKQYLNKEELIEFYKYAIYNKLNIILIDSQSYGVTSKYEKKLIIDTNLDELML